MRDITYTIHNNENLHNDEISIGIFLLIMNKRQNNIRNKSCTLTGMHIVLDTLLFILIELGTVHHFV